MLVIAYYVHNMASLKGVEICVPLLGLKENCELKCWRDFILRFEISLINTSLALHDGNDKATT